MRIKKTSETRALAGTILNAQNSSTTDTYSCDYINGIKGQVLWTNQNPNSSFAPQNITLNNNDYSFYETIFILTNYDYPNYATLCSTGKIPYIQNRKFVLFSYDYDGNKGNMSCGRLVTFTSKTLFNVAKCERFYTIGVEENNQYCIPLYVIGYK